MKRFLSFFLALVLTLSLTGGVVPAYAEEDSQDSQQVSVDTTTVPDAAEASYPMDTVETGLLVSHTAKTSEADKEKEPEYPTGDEAVSLSCNKSVYNALGWNADELTKNAQNYAQDENNQNPLAGYSFIAPEELIVFVEDNPEDSVATMKTYDDPGVAEPSLIEDDSLQDAMDERHFEESKWYQTRNGVGIDVDGDGIDEYAELTLYKGYQGSEDGHSIAMVELFGRNGSKWELRCSKRWNMTSDDKDDYVWWIPANQSRGYTAMTAGDFDHDGVQELAVYLADKGEDDTSADACVEILKFSRDGKSLGKTASISLEDINRDYGKMGEDWNLPVVSLSTCSLRLGNPIEKKGAYHYEPFTDLVINVSVPKAYQGKNNTLTLNSTTAIYRFDSGLKPSQMFSHTYDPDNNQRMSAVNSCEADLNGDGYKELVVAGIPETGLHDKADSDKSSNDKTAFGSYDNTKSLVNIIYYDNDQSKYRMCWSAPKEADALETLDPNYFKSLEPVALCAARFDPTSPGLQDQLFLQGVFLRCENALITGPANYVKKDSAGNVSYCIISNTSPYKEAANFPEDGDAKDAVTFTNLNGGYNPADEAESTGKGAWIDSCAAGYFLAGSGTACVAMVSSDQTNGGPDMVNMAYQILSLYQAPGTQTVQCRAKTYPEFIDNQDVDGNSTCLFVCFLNCDDDAYYYRYTGTYASYSSPVLFTVVQVPPYYREANSIKNMQFDISTGVTNNSQVNVGLGLQVGFISTAKVPFLKAGTEWSFGVDAAYTHAWSRSKTVKHIISLLPDQDYAVVYVVPMLVNTYDILKASQINDPNATPDYYEVREPMQPTFRALSLDAYNRALLSVRTEGADYELPPTCSAPVVDPSEELMQKIQEIQEQEGTGVLLVTKSQLAKSGAGDPLAYYDNLTDVLKGSTVGDADTTKATDGPEGANINNGIASTGVALALGTSTGNSGTLTGKASFGFVFGAAFLGTGSQIRPNAHASIGGGGGRTNAETITYTALYMGLSKTQPDGVAFDSGDGSYSGWSGKNEIIHYDPNPGAATQSLSYNYSSVAVAYPLDYLKTLANESCNTNEDLDTDFTVYALSFYTPSRFVTPEPPLNVAVQKAQLNTTGVLGDVPEADGSADITLAWDSVVRNKSRAPDGYNIYMTNVQKTGASSNTIYLQNKEGPVLRNSDGGFTTYALHLDAGDWNDHCTFYIAPVFREYDNGELKVTEGILSGKLEIDSLETLVWGASVHFTGHPENVVFNEDDSAETAVFTASAEKAASLSSDMRFDWQTWNRGTRKWTTVYSETKSGQTADTKYELTCSGAEKAALIDVPVRCVVTCGNNSAQSAIAACVYRQDPGLGIRNGCKVYDGEPADPPAVYCSSDGDVTYTWYMEDGTELSDAPKDTGSYLCKASVAETETYKADEATGTVTIDPAQPAVSLTGIQIDTSTQITAGITGLYEADGTVTFTVTKGDGPSKVFDPVDVKESGGKYTAVLSETQAAGGDYTVKAVYQSSTGNYKTTSETKDFHKNKLTRTVAVSPASYSLPAGSDAFQLEPATETAPQSAAWSYKVVSDSWSGYDLAGTQAEPTVTVSDTGLVTVDHAGKAVIRITLKDPNGQYEDATADVSVEGTPAPLTVTSSAVPASVAYDELDSVTYGLTYTLADGTPVNDFKPVVGSLAPVPVTGDASETPYPVQIKTTGATVTANGQTYTDVFLCRDYDPLTYVEGSLTITPADCSDPQKVKVSKPKDVPGNGTEQKQSVTVTTADETALEEGKDYTLTYSGDPDLINAGSTVTVTVIGVGNYQGYQQTDYQILEAENNGGNYGGSGGGGGAAAPVNPVTVPEEASSGTAAHGSVRSSAVNAKAGDKVTLTVTPEEGYTLNQLTVTDARGNAVQLTKNADGTYSFIMPDSEVRITAAFVEALVTGRFDDVSEGAWYVDAVAWAVERGIMNGVSENLFAPNDPCTRAMVVTMLWRLAGEPASSNAAPFTDVKAGSWYADAVNWAAETSAVNGTSTDTFSPNTPVTREQLATILYRYAQAQGKGFTGSWMFLLDYPDADQVSDWANEAMLWMTMHGIITGMGDGTLAPKDNATRAQIATMFMRFCAEMEE